MSTYMMHEQIADAVISAEAFGLASAEKPLRFKSGMFSPVYLDNRRIYGQAYARARVTPWFSVFAQAAVLDAGAYAEVVLAAVDSGGTPHGMLVAASLGLPFAVVKKEAKGHGNQKRIEGATVDGRHVLLLEDHITTAGSSISAIEAIEASGGRVGHVFAITCYDFPKLWRDTEEQYFSRGITPTILLPFSALMVHLDARTILAGEMLEVVQTWFADPWEWTRVHEKKLGKE